MYMQDMHDIVMDFQYEIAEIDGLYRRTQACSGAVR